MSSINEVISKIKTLLDQVDGIGKVSETPGVIAEWAKVQRPKMAQWELDVSAVNREPKAIGCAGFIFYTIRIEGVMPFSLTNPPSTPAFRSLIDAVCKKLESNMSLLQSINDGGLPQVLRNDRILVESGDNAPAVLAHHCVIETKVREYYTFTTQ